MQRKNNKGFTLLEIMLVVTIVASLLAFLGKNVFDIFGKTKPKETRAKMGVIAQALGVYQLDCNRLPTSAEGLQALIKNPGSCQNWGPKAYIGKAALKDAWANDFFYESDGMNFTLMSYGADGRPGGEGDAADILNDE
jgi:general secretion pathway protein G